MNWLKVLQTIGFVSSGSPSDVTPVSADDPLPVDSDRHEFARISEKRYKDTEEARFDIPASLVSADIYVGVAPDGTATSAASWTVIRSYFDGSGNPSRQRIRFGITWDARASGW